MPGKQMAETVAKRLVDQRYEACRACLNYFEVAGTPCCMLCANSFELSVRLQRGTWPMNQEGHEACLQPIQEFNRRT